MSVPAQDDWSSRWPVPLIGRDAELAELERTLAQTRLLTLAGAGGIGKTRLAFELTRRARTRGETDVAVVDLAPVDEPDLVAGAVLGALGVSEQPGRDRLATAVEALAGREALLLFDNCEHVVNAVAEVAQTLLDGAPRARILSTSREPLHLADETVWRTPPLARPDPAAVSPVIAVRESGSGRLFLAVATRRRPELALTDETASAIVRICSELDGLPLAIELAAARVSVLTPTQIADGLATRPRLLRDGSPTTPARHRTLRASLDWSHALLGVAERTLLRRVSVFRGGWTLETAEAICAAAPLTADDILDLTDALIDKSLVRMTEWRGEARYGLHETVRQYAAEHLTAAGEREAVAAASLRHFAGVAEAANRMLDDEQGRARLDVEEANLRAALALACETDPSTAVAMAAGLARSWLVHGCYQEGLTACERVLELTGGADRERLAVLHWAAGNLSNFAQQYERGFVHAATGLELAEAAADAPAIGLCLQLMSGMVNGVDPIEAARLSDRGVHLLEATEDDYAIGLALANATLIEGMRDRFAEARGHYDHFNAHATASENTWLRSLAEVAMAWAEVAHGDPRRALAHADLARELQDDESMTGFLAQAFRVRALAHLGEARAARTAVEDALTRARRADVGVAVPALELARLVTELAAGDLPAARHLAAGLRDEPALHTAALVHDALARIALAEGDTATAREHGVALAALGTRTGSPRQRALAEMSLGAAALLTDDLDDARRRLHIALALQVDHDLRGDVPDCLEALGGLALEAGDARGAARLLGAAIAGRRELGCVAVPPAEPRVAGLRARGAAALGEAAWSDALAEGEKLSLEGAVGYARRTRGARKRPALGWGGLTPTEREVVDLIAAGLSNPEIAARLLMSRSTVKAHLAHVYAKLAITSRTELAAAAARRAATPR